MKTLFSAQSNFVKCFIVVFLGVALFALWGTPTQAASMTLATANDMDTYMVLKAKLEYLTALLASLSEGGGTLPAPTFAMALRGDVAQINGTIVRPATTGMMEICGPMTKGTIDWGDGVTEKLQGLGCSGDVFTFQKFHQYDESKSYQITVSGSDSTTKTIAAGEARTDTSRMLTVVEDEMEVTAYGSILLDEPLTGSCADTFIGTIDWGDGTSESLMSDGCVESYRVMHTYGMLGDYKILVRDIDGDAVNEVVAIK